MIEDRIPLSVNAPLPAKAAESGDNSLYYGPPGVGVSQYMKDLYAELLLDGFPSEFSGDEGRKPCTDTLP